MDEFDYKAKSAFSFMVIMFSKTMKAKGATDKEISKFMRNVCEGIAFLVQENKGTNRVIEKYIGDSKKQFDMKLDLLEEVSSCVNEAAIKALDPNRIKNKYEDKKITISINEKQTLGSNVVSFSDERLRRLYGLEMDDITKLLIESLRKDVETTEE